MPSHQITDIDLSEAARHLRRLRVMDYILVIVCGETFLRILTGFATDPDQREFWIAVVSVLVLLVLAFSIYTGWRHVGVIDGRVWGQYTTVFALLLVVCLALVFVVAIGAMANIAGGSGIEVVILPATQALVLALGVVLFGFAWRAVRRLRKTEIRTLDLPLQELLKRLTRRMGESSLESLTIKRINVRRGVVYAVSAGALLIASAVISNQMTDTYAQALQTADGGVRSGAETKARMLDNTAKLSSFLGFFLLIRMRRYFQVNADSLLSTDKRDPILFLRSFDDDEKVKFRQDARAFLDFSLETRLANHFFHFGPFIAVGSPTDKVPVPGAARMQLSDDAWQPRVQRWMSAAAVVVMYAGNSYWVNWELALLLATGHVTKLILMIPEERKWFGWARDRNVVARIDHLKRAFLHTPWQATLAGLTDYVNVRAMLFGNDGSLVVIRSRPRNRDSYHLAALVAHYLLLTQAKPMLVAAAGSLSGRQFAIEKTVFLVGAGADNDLVIANDDYVSWHHAQLRIESGVWSITDRSSTNGTFVNGTRLGAKPSALKTGDNIRVGRSTFKLILPISRIGLGRRDAMPDRKSLAVRT